MSPGGLLLIYLYTVFIPISIPPITCFRTIKITDFVKNGHKILFSVVRIFSNGFFVATVGDVELSGPLQISVDAPGLVLSPGEILRLLFWHTGDHKFDIKTAKFCDFLNSYKHCSCSF